MKKGIVGAGGFGNEVYWSLSKIERDNTIFFVEDNYLNINTNSNKLIKPLSEFNPLEYELVIAIGNGKDRSRIVKNLPKETIYFTHIHPSVQILGDNVEIGVGSIICAGSIITNNIKIGKHTHLNLLTTIGHDNLIGDYFTTAPGVKISGNCNIENYVYFGTNSCTKEKISICNDVTIGLNSGVVKNIIEPGIYIGTPTIKIK